ncbi:hypothetical protein [Actinoalloteichus caeruleus]|uniref:hypothetical protein n=1 Tax=Actinoalloteichus cyanogriseus TaxID=2893586 RepID=UPI0020A31A4F|nr:hypothetical protein [Actinoalloteichus caeruleus]
MELAALGPRGPYVSRNRELVADVRGGPLAELSLVPALFVQRAMRTLSKAESPGESDREAALTQAGPLFSTGVVGGVSAEEYHRAVAAASGMPITFVRTASQGVGDYAAAAFDAARMARPVGAVSGWRARRPDPGRRCGCDGVTCSPCTPRPTRPPCTARGSTPWRWATGWRCDRPAGSRSRRTDW